MNYLIKNNNMEKLPDLDAIVLAGLDFFKKTSRPAIALEQSGALTLVVGSVNAFHTARLLFNSRPAIFADESDLREKLTIFQALIKNGSLREAIIISASGEKDSIWEIEAVKKYGLKTTLLTCRENSSAGRLADISYVFEKYPEPYSYNFSTYLGMILSFTRENPDKIKKYLLNIKQIPNFKKYTYFSLILPDKFRPIADMLMVKDDELFGPHSSLRAYSEGQARHAKFICPSKKELLISFQKNPYFGLPENRWQLTLPKTAGPGLVLSLSYYLTGLLQKSRPPYFKRGLPEYCLKTGPKPYGQKNPFPLIVA